MSVFWQSPCLPSTPLKKSGVLVYLLSCAVVVVVAVVVAVAVALAVAVAVAGA